MTTQQVKIGDSTYDVLTPQGHREEQVQRDALEANMPDAYDLELNPDYDEEALGKDGVYAVTYHGELPEAGSEVVARAKQEYHVGFAMVVEAADGVAYLRVFRSGGGNVEAAGTEHDPFAVMDVETDDLAPTAPQA